MFADLRGLPAGLSVAGWAFAALSPGSNNNSLALTLTFASLAALVVLDGLAFASLPTFAAASRTNKVAGGGWRLAGQGP